jgi:hypothetical protein
MHRDRRLDALERIMRPVFSELKAVGIEARRVSEGCLSPGNTGHHDSSGPGASTMEHAARVSETAPIREHDERAGDQRTAKSAEARPQEPSAALAVSGCHRTVGFGVGTGCPQPDECGGEAARAGTSISPLLNGALTPPPLPEDRAGGFSGGELLPRMADTMRTIRAADGRLYAAVSHDGRLECHRLESDEFRRLLFRLSHDATGTVPKQAVVTNVLATLRSRAENSTDVQPVFLRVARDESGTAFVVDLGDAARRAVSVSAGGWEVVGHPGVLFWRPPGQRAFPVPERGGSIEQLQKYVNVYPRHWPLLLAWLTAALRPRGPYPVLVLTGEQGSAKTTLAQVCRRLVDPHAALLRSLPRSERDLMVSAHNNWLLAFDNISKLTDWQSDSVCRLSTGGSFAARGLFTDDREMFLSAQRPIILNGIDDFVTRGDLVDRSIFLSLPRIRPDQRRSDEEFWAEFDRDYAALFGSLLDAVAGGIRFWPAVELDALSRMADLDRWGEAVLRALHAPPGTFVNAYRANRRSACADALEESPVAAALVAYLAREPAVEVTPTELLRILTVFRPAHASAATGWPMSPWALSKILRRLAAPLRETGISVAFRQAHRGRVVRIARARPEQQPAAV